MKDESFSVRVKLETASKAVRKKDQRQTALCGLILSQYNGNLSASDIEIRIPDRLADLILQFFEDESISYKFSKGRLRLRNLGDSVISDRCRDILSDIEDAELSLEDARRILRGAFWGTGYCSDPAKGYRIEFLVQNSEAVSLICAALDILSIRYITAKRKDSTAVYFKNGDDVSDFLSYIGSPSAMMDFENVRAEKDVKSRVNRTVNCDAGNTKRQAEAAAVRNEQITKIMNSGKANRLPPELRDAAKAHMENPGASLAELGAMMNPPIGKSGMRHRLEKLAEFAENLQ